MKDTSYLDYIIGDVLAEIPSVTYKSMFSGWCLYKNGFVFALIIGDELFFKTDETNREQYKKRGSHPFKYSTKKKEITTSYWTLPEEIMENKELLPKWIEQSVEMDKRKKLK